MKRSPMRLPAIVLAFVLPLSGAAPIVTIALPVHAQTTGTTPSADALKKEGDDAMDDLRYADALAAYEKAYALTPTPVLLYNQARALQALNRHPEALDMFEKFSVQAPPELKAKVPQLAELIADERARVSTATIVCNVAGARVLVRERLVATTPLEGPLRVSAGKGFVDVIAEGYEPYRKELEFPGGDSVRIEVELLPKDKAGVLVVRALPNSHVFVDGKAAGNPPTETIVVAGPHHVRVSLDDYDDAETTTVVAVGMRKDVDLEQRKIAPITAKWWFWTGVGAVVITGVVVTAALLTERRAHSGDTSPGQVGAPLFRF
jgi:hypothetical protein